MTKIPSVKNKIYDLEERTAKFGEEIIRFCNKLPKTPITIPLITQLIKEEARRLWQEAKELNPIFNSIYKKLK